MKLFALQAEERSKRNLKLLEKSFQLGNQSLLSEAAEALDKAVLVELETKKNETTFFSSSKVAKSLNKKIVDSLFIYNKNKSKLKISCGNVLQPMLKLKSSDTSELLKPLHQIKMENSQWKGNEIIKKDAIKIQ